MKGNRENGILYEVVRSRRSTADIIIDRDGGILVRAPAGIDDQKIAEIVKSRQRWIFKTLAEWKDLNATRVLREYRNGEGFLYMGRAYRLLLVGDQEVPLQLRSGRFTMRRGLVERGGTEAAKAAFRDWYTVRGLDRINQRVHYSAPKVGVTATTVEVRELGNRWASCSTAGALSFHWKCMMAPLTIVDYIAVHELCHLHHRDHTDAFWNEVDKVMPDYLERKEWLRKNGAGLDV